MTDPRYPVGPFQYKGSLTPSERVDCIRRIAAAPERLRQAVSKLDTTQLDLSYREGGWTARQLVHHLADGQQAAFFRTKLALLEDNPVVNPFDENTWAVTADTKGGVEPSLAIIAGIHTRWAELLSSMKPEEFQRRWTHPQAPDEHRTIDSIVAYFAWHIEHHTAHIELIANGKT